MWGQLGWGHIYQDNDGQVQILGGTTFIEMLYDCNYRTQEI